MMINLKVSGWVNDRHQLSADVPDSIPPGPVTIVIVPSAIEQDAEDAWARGVAREWREELGDSRQDIYTLDDGEPIDVPG